MHPLREPTFFILLSLTPDARHGYAIMQDIAALSDGRVKLSTGTLYTALKRLLDDGWIEAVESADADPRRRQAYRLTPTGRRILQAETERLTTLATLAQQRLVKNS